MKSLLNNWNAFRFIKLILGITAIVQAITTNEIIFAFAGGVLSFMAIFNRGCCIVNGCAIDKKDHKIANKNIIYEEVANTK